MCYAVGVVILDNQQLVMEIASLSAACMDLLTAQRYGSHGAAGL
jgi:hypothetical protein